MAEDFADGLSRIRAQTTLLPRFRPDQPEDSPFPPRCRHAVGSLFVFGDWQMGRLPMMIKTSGQSALILATGLFVCLAAPSQAAGANDAAASAKPESAAGAPLVLNKHHWKKSAHRKSSDEALKSSSDKKAAATDLATADNSNNPPAIPPWVANANAQLPSSDVPDGNARAMSVRAGNILQAAPNDPADAQQATETQVVSADQLNDVDRALHESTPAAAPAQTTAPAEAPVARAAPVVASGGESSTWDQTSLIGKIFIGFGALLTVASAARMFMA
jgi:hypothetical protein